MSVDVVFLHGAGPGAFDADARLADSLAGELGAGYTVHRPRFPEDDLDDLRWFDALTAALATARAPLVLVGHSAGGYMLLRYLANRPVTTPVAAMCLIAAPFPGGDAEWTFDDFELPADIDRHLPVDAAVRLYASEDDAIVPFAHRDLYAAAIPRARVRTVTGGHQIGDDLRIVAADIRALT
ncbi:alpha/beta fold hydrolase [Microbacterium sp. Sa4CUA7]|uniref:Alpha/beta fold hydrolase n=1 Tax=Microbacterium pullorum TaxID=2762236 RepID=A0ABR8RYK8_9MICO|nr:alpha/beta fold hydrolase [Microbacterium pullorum]MBD7956320.1 alpha/beta fold hydrolase [Microbacterium pullorum]